MLARAERPIQLFGHRRPKLSAALPMPPVAALQTCLTCVGSPGARSARARAARARAARARAACSGATRAARARAAGARPGGHADPRLAEHGLRPAAPRAYQGCTSTGQESPTWKPAHGPASGRVPGAKHAAPVGAELHPAQSALATSETAAANRKWCAVTRMPSASCPNRALGMESRQART